MKLNRKLQRYIAHGQSTGRMTAQLDQLLPLSNFVLLPCFFPEGREGQAIKYGYEDAYFDAYLTWATGITRSEAWAAREASA